MTVPSLLSAKQASRLDGMKISSNLAPPHGAGGSAAGAIWAGLTNVSQFFFQTENANHPGFRSAAITDGAADHSDQSCNEPKPRANGTFADDHAIPGAWSVDVLCRIWD